MTLFQVSLNFDRVKEMHLYFDEDSVYSGGNT